MPTSQHPMIAAAAARLSGFGAIVRPGADADTLEIEGRDMPTLRRITVPTPTGDVHALAFFSTDGHILNSTRTVDGIYFFDIDIGEAPEDAADLARYLTAPICRTLEDAGAVMFADSVVVERVCDEINRAWLSAHDLPIVELLRLVRAVEVAECASRYIPEWVKCHDRLAVSLGAVSRILAQHPEETTGEAVAPGEAAEIDPSGLETLADGDFWRYDFPIVEPMTH